MKTPEQIHAGIQKLLGNKSKTKQFSAFGDDNHAAIYAAVETLRDNLDDTDLENKLDSEEWTQHEYDNAVSILEWKTGDDELDDYLYPENK